MNIQLLNTLLKLFAIIVKEDGLTAENKHLVRNFLSQQFNEATAEQYLKVFMEYAEQERAADEHQNIISLCTSVNNELTYEQKIFILIRVIELAFADNKVSMVEVKKIVLAAKYLNIEYREYQNIFNFITTKHPVHLELSNVLCVGLDENANGALVQADQNPTEYLAVLHIRSANLFILRYVGNSDLYLSGQLLKPHIVYILKQGSVIRGPRMEPIYFSDVVDRFLYPTREANFLFEARNVSYRFPEGKMGLNNIDLIEESGKMVAIMGGSGAGKSTLLSVLNGNRRPQVGGSVAVNGVSIHEHPKSIEGVIGFVAQDDMLIEELTVYQNLYFNAQLCFDYMKPDQLEALVLDILGDLGLFEIRELKVGNPLYSTNISGGQRKRLNIALELIREPSILFVDEPTSGLSSADSENVMGLLKELAHKGKLVFVVIHQPSSEIYKLFDKLLLLDKGGFPVYYGNPIEAIRYFRRNLNFVNSEQVECTECGAINPEQIFTIVETKIIDEFGNATRQRKYNPEQWSEIFRQNFVPPVVQKKYDELKTSIRIPSPIKQFKVFFKRDILAKLANRSYMIISLLVAPLLAIVIAYLLRSSPIEGNGMGAYRLYYNEDLTIYLFVSILIALFVGMTISSEEILRDRKLRKREQFLHLSKNSYLTSKIAVLFGFTAIQMLAYVVVGNSILAMLDMGPDHWILLFTVGCFAVLVGLNVSATFDSAVTIYVTIPILLIPQIVLSGPMVSFHKLNPLISNLEVTPVISDLAASRWAYEALAVRQFKDNQYRRQVYPYDKIIENAKYDFNHLLPLLSNKVDYCINHLNDPNAQTQVAAALRLTRNELMKYPGVADDPNYRTYVQRLKPDRFNERVGKDVQQRVVRRLEDRARDLYHKERHEKELYIKQRQAQGEDLTELQFHHGNELLERIVTAGINELSYLELDGRVVRVSEPVYMDPNPDKGFFNYREHFYAPSKRFMGHVLDTFWFNIGVIWFMTATLYLSLYFEFFRQVINHTDTFIRRSRRFLDARRLRRAAGRI